MSLVRSCSVLRVVRSSWMTYNPPASLFYPKMFIDVVTLLVLVRKKERKTLSLTLAYYRALWLGAVSILPNVFLACCKRRLNGPPELVRKLTHYPLACSVSRIRAGKYLLRGVLVALAIRRAVLNHIIGVK